jgi:hypothetical protein
MNGTKNAPEKFRIAGLPTDRLAGILPGLPSTYNVLLPQPVGNKLFMAA